MTVYLSIDPGVGTGVAYWNTGPDGAFWSTELFSLQEVAECVRDIYVPENTVLITEKFTISQRTVRGKVFYESLYFNGWLSIEYPNRIEQTKSQVYSEKKKTGITDPMLKFFGWWLKTKDGHANDAARHLAHRAIENNEPWIVEAVKNYAISLGNTHRTEQ